MTFFELDRDFVDLDVNHKYGFDTLLALSSYGGRGKKWDSLLERKRVVILGDAASGKTAEFRNRARRIAENKQGFAIYTTVERLSENGLINSLKLEDRQDFEEWKRSAAPGWFFLDSIDEARINRKDVEIALNRFTSDLGAAYPRARVILSCRGNVWDGEGDLALVEQVLPIMAEANLSEAIDRDAALFQRGSERKALNKTLKTEPDKFLLVALGAISASQRTTFLTNLGVTEINSFEAALFEHGLKPLSQRPGDLIMLIRYWKANRGFGSFSEMMEFGIEQRLKEENPQRQGAITVSETSIRSGVERLAAALTLGQAMELSLPDADDAEAKAIDPYDVLKDWNRADVESLLQRGLFIPATFGRVRFFHRAAQEYLTANWFQSLMPGLTDAELFRTFLANSFGLETVPPSLRAAAAWLAVTHKGIRQELIRRTPQVLMHEGDPGSLDIADREQLLGIYAEHDLAGKITTRPYDTNPLWMFASEKLAPSINRAVEKNIRPGFHFAMLQLIDEGNITGCADFVIERALDRESYGSILAAQILAKQKNTKALRRVANDLLAATPPLSADRTPALTAILFPSVLKMQDILELITRTRPARRYQVEGYRNELQHFFENARNKTDRDALLGKLADLAAKPPLEDWPKVSKEYHTLLTKCGDLARAAITRSDKEGISKNLVRFLRAFGHLQEDQDYDGDRPSVRSLVASRPALKQAIFWEDVAETLASTTKPVRGVYDIGRPAAHLWSLVESDIVWLEAALKRNNATERLLALDGLIRINVGDVNKLVDLAAKVAADKALSQQLIELRKPREISEAERKFEASQVQHAQKSAEREVERKKRLEILRDQAQADPKALSDSAVLSDWPGPSILLQLTHWISERLETASGYEGSAQAWDYLSAAFGSEVAEHYRAGMKTLWRVTPPERPTYNKKGMRTVKYAILLSCGGLALEASENKSWAHALEPDDAERAILHACLDDQGVPEWIGDIATAHPTIAQKHLSQAIRREWKTDRDYHPFLDKMLRDDRLSKLLHKVFVSLLKSSTMSKSDLSDTALQVLARLDLTIEERATLLNRSVRDYNLAANAGIWDDMIVHLRMIIVLEPIKGGKLLADLLSDNSRGKRRERAKALLKGNFSRHHGSLIAPQKFGPALLAQLTEAAYSLFSRAGAESDDDYHGHDPRDAFLNSLVQMDGEEAFLAVRSLSLSKSMAHLSHRMIELSNEIAERSADRVAWSAAAVRRYEVSKLASITTGNDLFELVRDLLIFIQWRFANDDLSPRGVVETAGNEAAVQEWLGSNLEDLSKERFKANREARVAGEKRPDLIITSNTAPVEVAIELKHDEMNWTYPALQNALHQQLVEQYLLPADRRHGLLVISNHRNKKFWIDKQDGQRISFNEVIKRLNQEATKIARNSVGLVLVAVMGLDAAPRVRKVAPEKDSGTLV